MLIDRKNYPQHRVWIFAAAFAAVLAIGWYAAESAGADRWPGGSSRPGLTLGIVAGLIIVFEFLLWPRKMVRAWRVGRAQDWLRAHLWLGILTVPLIVLHTGFELGGQLSSLLTLLFAAVIGSGIFGLTLQQFLPRVMLRDMPAETIYSQIDYVANQLCRSAENLVLATCGTVAEREQSQPRGGEEEVDRGGGFVTVGAVRVVGQVAGKVLQTQVPAAVVPNCEPLRHFFYSAVEPYLLQGRRSASPLRDPLRAPDLFQQLATSVDPGALPVVKTLESLCQQRRQFDLQARLHRWLHLWLAVHLPLSAAVILLMFIHVFVALKYW